MYLLFEESGIGEYGARTCVGVYESEEEAMGAFDEVSCMWGQVARLGERGLEVVAEYGKATYMLMPPDRVSSFGWVKAWEMGKE